MATGAGAKQFKMEDDNTKTNQLRNQIQTTPTQTNPGTKPKSNHNQTLTKPKLKQTTLHFQPKDPIRPNKPEKSPPTNPNLNNQTQPNPPQQNQYYQPTPEETTTMKQNLQHSTQKTKLMNLKPPPELKKSMKTTPKPNKKPTSNNKKPANRTKQQQTSNIKSIRKFFEQFQSEQQQQQQPTTTTTTILKKTPNKSDLRTQNSHGIAHWTRLDATEKDPLSLDPTPAHNILLAQQLYPASSRNLPSYDARDPAVGELSRKSEGTLALPRDKICKTERDWTTQRIADTTHQ